MHCHRVRKLLVEYVDETLPIGQEEEVRQHLEGCRQCANLAEGMGRTVSLLQAMPRLETSPDFTRNLRRHLPVAVALSRRQPARAGFLSRVSQWASGRHPRRLSLVLAPLALGLGLAFFLWSPQAELPVSRLAPAQPVISQDAYLAALAREHVGYASEHPLVDTSAASLVVNAVSLSSSR